MKRDIESMLLGTDELARRGRNAIINNMGIVIAVAVAIISALVSFTDVSFDAFLGETFFPSLLFLLTNAIEDVIEPYLMQLGFVQRTPRGRVITDLGYAHLGLEK